MNVTFSALSIGFVKSGHDIVVLIEEPPYTGFGGVVV